MWGYKNPHTKPPKKMKKTTTTKLTTAEKAFNIFYLLSPIIVLLICYIKNL